MITLKKLSLSKREQLLIIIFLMAALYFIGWHVAGKSLLDELNSIRSSTGSLRDEQAILLSLIEEGATLEETFLKEKEQHEQLMNILPDLESLPRVLNEMETFLADKAVTINSLRIGDTIYYDQHAAVFMQLKTTAAPFHLLDLQEQIEKLPNIISFDYLTWNNPDGSDVEMELQLQLLFYHPEGSAQTGGGIF